MHKILLVEDHALVRLSVTMLLRQAYPDVSIHECDTVSLAFEALEQNTFDLLILDLSMRNEDGLAVLRAIRQSGKSTPVLVQSMYEEPEQVIQALQEGANGYIAKGDNPENLLQAINTILRGKDYLSETIQSQLAEALRLGKSEPELNPLDLLSAREREVFDLLGQDLTPKEAAFQLHISSRTIDTHIERMLEKLQLQSRHQLLCLAIRKNAEKKYDSK
jgi:two-component system, NarL family, invasion response regulator UvrY